MGEAMDTEGLDAGEFKGHLPCKSCGSSDGLADYGDHTFCFVCEEYTKNQEHEDKLSQITDFILGEAKALKKRGINANTAKKWDYRTAVHEGGTVQVANYRDGGREITGQKVRRVDKTFFWTGTPSQKFWGQHKWKGGRRLVVTEGEIDALTVSQLGECKWPTVSVPNGAQSAKNIFKKNIEWLEKFDQVVICFDQDDEGQKAAEDCAVLLSPGKVFVVSLPLKDANAMLMEGRVDELTSALWEAQPWRPDGIVGVEEVWENYLRTEDEDSYTYPFQGLNEKFKGIRKQEIVCITAGTGQGKSQVAKEVAFHLIQNGLRIGYVALEESNLKTLIGLLSLHLSTPYHLNKITSEDKDKMEWAMGDLQLSRKLYLYDHWGSLDEDNLMARLRFLAKGLDCDFIVLDHISIVVSGLDTNDERRTIDVLMTKLRSFVQETKVGLIIISHLKKPFGKGYEEGAQTSINSLRGSASIAQISDNVFGLERDQQGEDPDLVTVRILKNRLSGETGIACYLRYNRDTGRLREVDPEMQKVFDQGESQNAFDF
jgi:twinkle protein